MSNKTKQLAPPNHVVEIPNPDKKKHEKWTYGRDLWNFPRPYRWGLCGSPNSGKTSLVLNALLHTQPHWDRIFIIHPTSYNPAVSDSDQDKNLNVICETLPAVAGRRPECDVPEYKGVEAFYLQYIPTEQFWVGLKGFTLCIIDDIDITSYTKRVASKQRRINKLFSYVSTHNNVSIIVTSQSPSTQLPAIVLQMCNITTIFPQHDLYKLRTLSQKLSMDSHELIYYMSQLKSPHDTITFDNTLKSPMPIRKNITEELEPYTGERVKRKYVKKIISPTS